MMAILINTSMNMNVPTVYCFNCEVVLLRTPATVEALAIKDNSLFCLTTYFDST